MVGQHLGKRRFVLGLEQGVDRAGRQSEKAAFVGANTVNGPGLLSVPTRPAAFTAATSVVWSFEFTALSTMSFVGSIAAPPTMGLAAVALLPLMPMPPAQAPSTTETPMAITSFFIERLLVKIFLKDLCGDRRQLGSAARSRAIRGNCAFGFALEAASALRHSDSRAACAQRACSPESALRFSATVFPSAPGDDQPPGRQLHSMNRFLNT
ncbi:hypothetical protein J2X90_000591 [Variovorax paradoxus]|nr:hypothetical protein [Variovorax paradoxus]